MNKFLKSLGPGILFASTAIGVSHLVQSTRAGADYGFGLLWAVILANVLKYPFFEYGARYASATGESLIDGYKRKGLWMLWLYVGITLASMFFVSAAVGAVTAGFMHQLFGLEKLFSIKITTALVFILCIAILLIGRYKILDRLIKVIGSVLLISTLSAFFISIWQGPKSHDFSFFSAEVLDPTGPGFLFLIALMGWMPTAVDLSAWSSLWTIARAKESGYRPSLKETLNEFRFGYWLSAFLAPCFLVLGAFLVYGTGQSLNASSAGFANDIISLYTENIGDWSELLIAASAFSIMFGTCIAVFDGYARAGRRVIVLLQNKEDLHQANSRLYSLLLLVIGGGALAIYYFFGSSLKSLVDIATSISFVIAPIIAIVNFQLVSHLPEEAARPKLVMRILSYVGIIFLSAFSLIYLFFGIF
ncbi:MAG: divalent metal cation transporter [Bacteroidetes bacterium]|nr:MAG: divalent metal cation transporter [Bacteroidota bacterium]